ncbi:hypothetical protein VNI00_016132 [Paramarasmius palmivorus]|uniref:Uncharacterized protein n=1 Tax=Paramarasmius palmivorus TaxID=297713 RepID=A0AAW0BD70_9AGAR
MTDMAEWVVHAALRSIVLNDYIVMGPDTHLRLAFDAHAFSMFDSYCRSPPNVVSRTQSAWADSLRYHALEQFA